mmetsp:Transcript_4177/g.3634  ORF Transcript_4177/g.3634 Transcript_4177/m.3634 type:complete len:526 (-) Transcript_4177:130-1707(-)|eukprot:CAMPEP_0179430062 /NCGR_PEP_ID=MMETSP0799-20121207/15293_1 /TAXON_ID=46947 /ORGANISM="Geminigera cryophila, Strain CCMP2564" /LENGTH=525 /DNA_ID=CAMNT_0021206299 /DNA_START=56 /DNA_END=1633 /DNA_ORIENTATION=+
MHIPREGLFNRFFSRTTRRPSHPAPALTAQALPPTRKDVTRKQGQTASAKHQVIEEAAEPADGEAPVLTATLQHKFVTRIHGKYYNLEGFKHPGGPVALSLIGGRDGTPLFESHHPFTSQDKLQAILGKYLIPDQEAEPQATALAAMIDEHEDGGHYEWADGDAFESELKHKVKDYFRKEADRRGVSLLEATKATPQRWMEIAFMWIMFACTVPSLVSGEWWALVVTPVLSWIWMVNFWHDACHFALSSRWWINASVPYLGPWFSSPTTWYHQHVIGHHSYPNVGHKDPDLAHAPSYLREHASVRWRAIHGVQHRWWRVGFVWSIGVGIGLHIAADAKLLLTHSYNRVVPAMPTMRTAPTIAAHVMGRAVYVATTFLWPWLVFDSQVKALIFATVPIGIFSVLFMVNSQINHLTPDTAHAFSSNFWRHQVVTAQDFGTDGSSLHRLFCFFMSGGLNYQVEHHLFPTVCHCHHAALHPIVVEVCEKYKVPFYRREGYIHAMRLHFAHVHDMSSPPGVEMSSPAATD